MARRRKYKRRRTRGRFAFLYKLLTFAVVCGAAAVALAYFFKVETIVVTGNARYSEAQIVEASGLQIGDNMFLLNKYETSERITSALPYVATVRISRQLPGTLVVSLTECSAPAALVQDGKAWLLSGDGKVVDSVAPSQASRYTQITGLHITEPAVGQVIRVAEEDESRRRALIALLGQLNEKEMLSGTDTIALDDLSLITMQYLERFEVRLSWDADFDYKLDYLSAVIGRLEANETGIIDMTQPEKVSFIPIRQHKAPSVPADSAETSAPEDPSRTAAENTAENTENENFLRKTPSDT